MKYFAGFGLSLQPPKKPSPSGKRQHVKKVHRVEQEAPEKGAERFEKISRNVECHVHKKFQANACEASGAEKHHAVIKARSGLLEEVGKTSLSGIYLNDTPIRGHFGSAEIWHKKVAVQVAKHTYNTGGNPVRKTSLKNPRGIGNCLLFQF